MSTALQDCYATVTTVFGAGGEYYTNGHRGADYRRTARQSIYAYEDTLIESVDYGSGLGWSWGGKLLTGAKAGSFAGGAHLWSGSLPREGATIAKGDVIGYVAGFDDVHGSLWTGPHIHTTAGSVSAYNCSVGIRPLYDPAPQIAASVASAATSGGSSTTITNRKRRRGDEEMAEKYYRKNSTGEIGRFGAGVKIFGSEKDYNDHREAVIAYKSKTPGVDVVIPPAPTADARNFTNLDDRHWNIEVAVHGGTY